MHLTEKAVDFIYPFYYLIVMKKDLGFNKTKFKVQQKVKQVGADLCQAQ